ncbi:hypothetical protein [Hymenobacter sp. AT01-02]|uniref:hypothetical protein n=1 Tax=Hymenobacter sp. AT01-02 TaxID=1571877 RepID=UPI0005F11742|nr:hypothetical protein [Hymenobacter sp. AT01-02]
MRVSFFLLLPGALLWGATTVRAQQALPRLIPGTHVVLVPPAGFNPAPGLTGVRKGDAAIQVFDLVGGNYYKNAASFSKARFEARGTKVLDYQELTVQGYPARLARVQTTPTQESAQLMFGDSTFAVQLVGIYPAADAATGTAVREALLTAAYQKNLASDPFARAVFAFDEKKSSLAFAKASGNLYVYAPGGQRKDDYGMEPLLTVTPLPYNPSLTAASISNELLRGLDRFGFTGFTPRKMSSAKVNDLLTYETEGFGQMQGQRVLLYQQVTIIGNTAVACRA